MSLLLKSSLSSFFLFFILSFLFDHGRTYRTSNGINMVPIPAGEFIMGWIDTLPKELYSAPMKERGDFDEKPLHRVKISQSFYLSETEITNKQYEEFDPSHKQYRKMYNFSTEDDDAVIFVSWYDAQKFVEWLSAKEGKTYRLPTEGEWEYACRAGTNTIFNTGNTYPKQYWVYQTNSWFPGRPTSGDQPSLKTGRFPPNAWGLKDMHGNVEEWTSDWYGEYQPQDQVDPMGPPNGVFKITRGGSHSTPLYYLRSANRLGALPEDKQWYIGFRIASGGKKPEQQVEKNPESPVQVRYPKPLKPISNDEPYFNWIPYVKVPSLNNMYKIPFPYHNHDPAVAALPNGDVLAIWYTTYDEAGRELGGAYSFLRSGSDSWESAEVFWDTPDRNDHAPALFFDQDTQKLYHFQGLSAAGTWGNLAIVMRISSDYGNTWGNARFIFPEHGLGHMPVTNVIKTSKGIIIIPTDNTTEGSGHTSIHLSRDEGQTWTTAKSAILGIHGSLVELKNGSLLAFGRGNDINGYLAQSLSNDLGETWNYSASPFPGIIGGQRDVLLRLREGPILYVGFACNPMPITDISGKTRNITGLFTSVTLDEGNTWINRRPVSDDSYGTIFETLDGEQELVMDYKTGEPRGYMAVTQGFDNMIHLISSRNHYRFNLKWLLTPPPERP